MLVETTPSPFSLSPPSFSTALELEVDTTDMKLDELLAAGASAVVKRGDEIKELRANYENQLRQLKELIGDQNDRLEMQQNSFERLSRIAGGVQGRNNS